MEALDAAMDNLYSLSDDGTAVRGEGTGTGDPLDDFLGNLLPGGGDSVDAYLDDIMGPDAVADPEGSAGEAASSGEVDDFFDLAILDIEDE